MTKTSRTPLAVALSGSAADADVPSHREHARRFRPAAREIVMIGSCDVWTPYLDVIRPDS
jgi:hypothetical protein